MTREQGRRILDQLKTGEADYSASTIRRALFATGDLVDDPAPPSRIEQDKARFATDPRFALWVAMEPGAVS